MAKATVKYRDTLVCEGSSLYEAIKCGDLQEAEILYWACEVDYRRWNDHNNVQEAKDQYNKCVERKKKYAK